jgi:integrase
MANRRRANNDGSLFWSESEKVWIGQIVLPDGKRKRKRNKLQRVVKTWLDEQKELIRSGTWVSDESTKYGDFIDRYMSDVAAHTLKPKTLENYYFIIKNHIKPDLGDLKITAIRPEHLQSLYASRLARGLSKHTVVYIHSVIHKTLSTALKWGLVGRNVAEAVTVPRPEKNEIHPLSVDEVKKLLAVLEGDRLYAYYVLMSTSGIRKGECLGIQKDDLQLEKGTIIIRHTLSQVRGKGMILQEPKSEKSRRELALPSFTVKVLREHLDKHPSNSGYVFATGNGTPFSPRNILRHFKSKLKEAGLPESTRIHDLRHSFISWLLASGVPPKDVQVIAGHAQFATTMDIYAHIMPGANREAAKKIEGLFA